MFKIAYVYCITNNITKEKYVGQTTKSLELRMKWHICDSKNYLSKSHGIKKLYESMNKYGVENFTISILEETIGTDLDDRENYWICKLDSVNNGLNASYGRGGNIPIPHEEVLEMVKEYTIDNDLIIDIANKHGFHRDTVSRYLRKYITIESPRRRTRSVVLYRKDNNESNIFLSTREAARYIKQKTRALSSEGSISSKIVEVSKGKRKSVYGYYCTYV